MHPCQNARINTSVINLDSCKKWAPKHKYFKSYGELGIGSRKLCLATLSGCFVDGNKTTVCGAFGLMFLSGSVISLKIRVSFMMQNIFKMGKLLLILVGYDD